MLFFLLGFDSGFDMETAPTATPASVSLEVAEARSLSANELEELVEAATDAIRNDGGFGWLRPPTHEVMRLYWRGVLLIPEARLFIAKLDGAVCGSVQLWFRPSNNEAQRLIGEITTFFVLCCLPGPADSDSGQGFWKKPKPVRLSRGFSL